MHRLIGAFEPVPLIRNNTLVNEAKTQIHGNSRRASIDIFYFVSVGSNS